MNPGEFPSLGNRLKFNFIPSLRRGNIFLIFAVRYGIDGQVHMAKPFSYHPIYIYCIKQWGIGWGNLVGLFICYCIVVLIVVSSYIVFTSYVSICVTI